MKILILLTAITYAVGVDLQAVETQSAARSVQQPAKTVNTISISQKPDQYYQQQQFQLQQPQIQHAHLQAQQPAQQYYPLQYISTPIYQQPQPQPAMIIIAQPPQISQQTMISHAAQQLLNYFNSNPQARYQFLQGNYQPQSQQTYVPQQTPAPAYTYQIMSLQPQYQQVQSAHAQSGAPIVASPQISSQSIPVVAQQPQQISQHTVQSNAQESYGQLPHFQLPIIGQFGHTTHIPHIATLSQLTTQKYIPQIPLRTSPAIVTGLENFTPEQQAQIKAQLQTGGPITPLRSNLPPNLASSLQQSQLAVKAASPSPTQNTSPQEFPDEDKNPAQQTQAQAQTNSFSSGLNYGNQFTKG